MKFSERRGWSHLEEMAGKQERELRQVSLIRAYSWIEHALGAAGLRRGRDPVSKLLFQAFEKKLLSYSLTSETIRKAVQTRHAAAHMDTVPDTKTSSEAIRVLKDIWESLRKHYVTLATAAEIARLIQSRDGILSVSLFGSLARNSCDPNDIDLLVFDDGRYSDKIDPTDRQYLDTGKLTRTAMKLLRMMDFPFPHVLNCRWLDIVIIDGTLFGKNITYTRNISTHQPDPYFFLNISKDLRDYDFARNKFIDTSKVPFLELRTISSTLAKMGFL